MYHGTMTTDVFPSLEALGRPSSILDIIAEKKQGIVIVGGGHYSGRTTTVAALAHELMEQGLSVVQVRLPHLERLPGLDGITATHVDETMISHLCNEGRPDVLVLNDVEDPELYNLACLIAAEGSLVIVGMYSKSANDSIAEFLALLPGDRRANHQYRHLIFLSLHQKFVRIKGGGSVTQADINQLKAVNDARNIFIAEDSKRYFLSQHRANKILQYQTVTY